MSADKNPEISGRYRGKRIMVLLGGETAERDVSLATGDAIARALVERGYDVLRFDWQAKRISEFVSAARGVGAVFIALHGGAGEGGAVQGILDVVGTPYTGSGVLASALAMDKHLSKSIARNSGVPTADWELWKRADAGQRVKSGTSLEAPLVVKPSADGSSHGVSILSTLDTGALETAVQAALAGKGDVMLERFINGREVTVAVFDGEALGVCEIQPADGWYDYESKYQRSDTRYLIPSTVGSTLEEECKRHALKVYQALGCRGVARVDFIVELDHDSSSGDLPSGDPPSGDLPSGDPPGESIETAGRPGRETTGTPWLLELNTIPGMTSTSLVPKIAQARGVDFPTLCEWILERASVDS